MQHHAAAFGFAEELLRSC